MRFLVISRSGMIFNCLSFGTVVFECLVSCLNFTSILPGILSNDGMSSICCRFERERTCPLCRALVKPADIRSFGDGSTSLFFQLF